LLPSPTPPSSTPATALAHPPTAPVSSHNLHQSPRKVRRFSKPSPTVQPQTSSELLDLAPPASPSSPASPSHSASLSSPCSPSAAPLPAPTRPLATPPATQQAVLWSLQAAVHFLSLLYIHAPPALLRDLPSWAHALQAALDSSIAGVQWFLGWATLRHWLVRRWLVLCPHPSLRALLASLLFTALKKATLLHQNQGAMASTAGRGDEDSDEQGTSSLQRGTPLASRPETGPAHDSGAAPSQTVEMKTAGSSTHEGSQASPTLQHIVDLECVLVSLLLDFPQLGPQCAQLFNLFVEYMALGPWVRVRLLHRGMLPALFQLLQRCLMQPRESGEGSQHSNGAASDGSHSWEMSSPALAPVHSLISSLVRQCRLHPPRPHAASAPGTTAGDMQQQPPNPYKLGGLLVQVPEKCSHILRDRQYLSILVEVAMNVEEAALQLQFCCWDDSYVSAVVLQEVMALVDSAMDTSCALALMGRLLSIPDQLQHLRCSHILHGPRPAASNQPGLMKVLAAHRTPYSKRYALLKWLVELTSSNAVPDSQEVLSLHKNELYVALEWLQRDIAQYPSSSSPHPSNSSDFLTRKRSSVSLETGFSNLDDPEALLARGIQIWQSLS